jgi:hypothetical protein
MSDSPCKAHQLGWKVVLLSCVFSMLPSPGLADDSATFNKSLQYTAEVIAKHHLIALVEIEPLSDEKPVKLRYDRYPEIERVQMGKSTYVRKKGKAWMQSEDWGKTGSKVKPAKSTELDALISFPDAPLKNRIVAKDKDQGGFIVELIKREPADGKERLFYEVRRENSTNLAYPQFVFSPWKAGNDEEALLIGYGGLMYSGEVKVKVNINYQYMFLVNMVEKQADGEEAKPTEKAAPSKPSRKR